MKNELYSQVSKILLHPEEVVIVTMGNEIRSDDTIGIEIGNQLNAKLPHFSNRIFNAYNVPVNYVNKIVKLKPKKIFYIDSIEMGKDPGTITILKACNLTKTSSFTTHYQELDDMLHYIKMRLNYLPAVFLLGIQIKNINILETITPSVRKSGDLVVEIITKILINKF